MLCSAPGITNIFDTVGKGKVLTAHRPKDFKYRKKCEEIAKVLLIPLWALFKLIGVSLFMSGLKTIARSLETCHFWNASLTDDLKIKRIVALVDQFSKLRRILSEGRCINYLTCFDFKSVVRVFRKSILK